MLVAILLVALATILAASVAYESAMSARRSISTFSFDESMLAAEAAEALAAYGLREVARNDKSGYTYPGQPWGQPVGPVEVVPGITLEASLEDLQGRFNLNSLVYTDGSGVQQPDPVAVATFRNLLTRLNIEDRWADMLVDWIDTTPTTQPDGAEDSTYLGQNPPYLTANQYITSTTELLALPGFGHDRYAKLAPYVTALPPGTTLNLCSASPFVLDAFLAPGRQEFSSDADGFEKQRASAGTCFPTEDEYRTAAGADYEKAATMPAQQGSSAGSRFGKSSNYFRLSSLVTIGSAEFNLYSLLYRDSGGAGGGGNAHVILRSFTPD
jgi:general secretion pathway protein K